MWGQRFVETNCSNDKTKNLHFDHRDSTDLFVG
jgi:hypothetical protein